MKIKDSKVSSFQVSKSQCSKFSNFQIFKVSKFQRFTNSVSYFWKILIPYPRFSKHIRWVFRIVRSSILTSPKLSKTPAACHRRTPKPPAPIICEYCMIIFAFQVLKEKQQKHRQVELSAEISVFVKDEGWGTSNNRYEGVAHNETTF